MMRLPSSAGRSTTPCYRGAVTADYLVPIGDDGWHLWTDLELRGAGFPGEWVARLGDPAAARLAAAWLEAEAVFLGSQTRLVTALEVAATEAADEASQASLRRVLARVRQDRQPDERPPGHDRFRDSMDAWQASRVDLAAKWAELEVGFNSSVRRASAELRIAAQHPAFHEAILWQNRTAVRTAIAPLLRRAEGFTNSKTRQYERLVASYIQRYCAKNDRIGFFGPHAWGRLVTSGPALSARPGPVLLARRIIRVEAWAVHALGDRLAIEPDLRMALAPRLLPTVRLEGQTLHHSVDRASELPVEYGALLASCDGCRSARDIARALIAEPALDLTEESEVYAMLDELVEKRVVVWTVDTPTSGGRPEDLLRAELGKIEPAEVRGRALGALAELERARDDVARAAGSPERLDAALQQLDETFTRLTGTEASRRAGQTYAGRTVAFELGHRDIALEVGPGVWRELAGPLELLLLSARWFTWEIAARYRLALTALHRRLVDEAGGPRVEYLRFAASMADLFPGDAQAGSIVDQVRQELRARWKRVIGFDDEERVVRRSASALHAAAREAFGAPGPGWPAARHQSIDVMLAAPTVEAIARGEFKAVLGELHPGLNTHLLPDLPHPYGSRDVLFERRDHEIGRACVAPVWSRARTHFDYYSRSPIDFDVEHSSARSWRPRDRVLAAADLVVELVAGELEIATRDGRIRFDVIAFLEHHLIAESHQQFGIVGGGAHTPRVEIDRLVVARERWSWPAAEIEFAAIVDPVMRFARARAWAVRHGLPRLGFLRTPEEIKPTYLDLESPTYVDLAARSIRAASQVTVSEMLPTFDECWLPDAEGRRYTSEIRMVASDPQVWRSPRSEQESVGED